VLRASKHRSDQLALLVTVGTEYVLGRVHHLLLRLLHVEPPSLSPTHLRLSGGNPLAIFLLIGSSKG